MTTTALECGMELVDMPLTLHPQLRLTTPRALAPAGRITFGFHRDTYESAMIALEAMLDWMGELYGLERRVALAMVSLAADLHITQLVNADVRGGQTILPYDALGGV